MIELYYDILVVIIFWEVIIDAWILTNKNTSKTSVPSECNLKEQGVTILFLKELDHDGKLLVTPFVPSFEV